MPSFSENISTNYSPLDQFLDFPPRVRKMSIALRLLCSDELPLKAVRYWNHGQKLKQALSSDLLASPRRDRDGSQPEVEYVKMVKRQSLNFAANNLAYGGVLMMEIWKKHNNFHIFNQYGSPSIQSAQHHHEHIDPRSY